MALNIPTAEVLGALIDVSDWQKIVDSFTFLANAPACRVYHNTTQAVADATETSLVFNSERHDPAGMHSTVTNTGRITITDAGVYMVSFSGEFTAGTDYLCLYSLCRLNGTTVIGRSPTARHDSGDGSSPATSFAFLYKFAAADYIEVRAYQNNGANTSRNMLSTGNFSPEFAAQWVALG